MCAKIVFVFVIIISFTFTENLVWADDISDYPDVWEKLLTQFTELLENSKEDGDSNSSNQIAQYTRPTFGLDHESNQKIVEGGFQINNKTFTINDNYHTPFLQQVIKIGETNSFDAKVYADKGLHIQEFLFGIPDIGNAHLAELGVEVWLDSNGEIQKVNVIQKSAVIEEKTIFAKHEKTKCSFSDIEEKCDFIEVSMIFLEPLRDNVMALKAIDFKNRYQITYLNEGIQIAGDSLNPMKTMMIPSNIKGEGLMKVTQTEKYSDFWISEDGMLFEKNDFDSFHQINKSFERYQDTGNPYTRLHSEFAKIIAYEEKRASQLFDSTEIISDLPDVFTYDFPERHERITKEIQSEMEDQEKIAKKILDESNVQARWF